MKICTVEEACWRGLSSFETKREAANHPHAAFPLLSMRSYVPQSYIDKEMESHSLQSS